MYQTGHSVHVDKTLHVRTEEAGVPVPRSFRLYQNRPNPFNAETLIDFELLGAVWEQVSIDVFDILGRRVTTLFSDRAASEGRFTCSWDGRDQQGHRMPSGVYFYRLTAGDRTAVRRMVLLK